MLTFVTWRWSRPKYRSTFGPETVNVLRSMVARHYQRPHRFLCVTDDPTGLAAGIDVVPDWGDFADVPSPHGAQHPSCYRRLRMFAPDAGETFGERFVAMDLDCVVTGDLVPLFDRPEDLVLWRDPNPKTPYNGSLLLMTAGARPQVWTEFDPASSPRAAFRAGYVGSDQGWIGYRLGRLEATFTRADGVYSFRQEIGTKALPANAKVIVFHGRCDPWAPQAQRLDWVRAHWQ